MDFIDDLLNQMSSAFNQETAIPKKEEISMDETLKWRALKNNQFAARTRLPQQTAGSGGSGATRPTGLSNGRKSAGGASSGTASGSTPRRERRRTVGGGATGSSVTAQDGSRSPAALLGANGTPTDQEDELVVEEEQEEEEEEVAEEGEEVEKGEENIEIEIAKDISGEELQEALGLSQLIEVESTEEFTGTMEEVVEEDRLEGGEEEPESVGDPEGSGEEQKGVSPTLEMLESVEKEEVVEQEECKPEEDELDSKSSLLEVPYCNSASVSPVLAERTTPIAEDHPEPLKCDVDGTDVPMNVEREVQPDGNVIDGEIVVEERSGSEIPLSDAESADKQEAMVTEVCEKGEAHDKAAEVANVADDHVGKVEETAAQDMDDVSTAMGEDEDDVLIISTNEQDEVVELAETSKEDDDDDDAASDSKITTDSNADDRAKSASPQTVHVPDEAKALEKPEPVPTPVVAIPTENVAASVEEKYNPTEAVTEQPQKLDKHDDGQPAGDYEEIKYSDALKSSISGAPAKADEVGSQGDEKVDEKTDEVTMAEDRKPAENEPHTDGGSAHTSTEGSSDKAKQPAGRTTRSKKVVAGAATASGASLPSSSAVGTLSQRRSQRFQKESSLAGSDGKVNGEIATDPSTVVVKQEELDDGVTAKKRASVGSSSEAKLKGALRSDRSLRSKQQGAAVQPTVTTRRASETVKTAAEEGNDSLEPEVSADKSTTTVGRRGRKRLSQDRSVATSELSAVVRTREKSSREEPSKEAEQRRVSRSGFPLEPDESDTGGKTATTAAARQEQEKSTPQQQQPQQPAPAPPQRRGRKRKNPGNVEATPPTATSTPTPGATNADKPPLHPYKRAARVSRDGSDGILASALARRDKVDSQGRLSRPIKLSAKILANEELRQGFEQHNNGRIIIGPEPASAAIVLPEEEPSEPEKPRKQVREVVENQSVASSSTIGSSTEDVTLVSVTLPTPKPQPGPSGGSAPKRVPSSVEAECEAGPSVPQPQSRKPAESVSSSDRLATSKAKAKQAANAKAPPCPDVETFLQEIRAMRLGSNRPSRTEDNRKLNRRQQKRAEKMKEKFMAGLGLNRQGAHQQPRNNGTNGDDFDGALSAGGSDSSGSEADFVPPQKIGTVGRPNVTLRLRKPETLLENPPRKVAGTANRVPLVTVPSGVSKAALNTAVRQPATGQPRQVGKQTNGKGGQPLANGAGKASRSSTGTVVLPAAMTTLVGRPSASKTVARTAPVPGAKPTNASAMLKDKETEQFKRSLQRLGCEITLIPTVGRTDGGPRSTPSPAVAGPSRGSPAANAWQVRRAKDATGTQKQRSRNAIPTATPPILPGTTSPSLQIVLGGASPVRVTSGLVASTSRAAMPNAASPTSETPLICHCRQKSDLFVQKTTATGFCTGIDDIDGQLIGCCNELSNDLLNMLRPSARVSFQLLCNMHRKRLEDHGCCAICGRFCTQGNFAMCKNAHLFHPGCADKYTLNTPYNPARPGEHAAPTLVLKCPHCSQECPNGEIEVNIQLTNTPVLLPSRKSMVKPAKMTVSKSGGSSKANGISGGSSNANDSFRTTVQSLVPNSVKNVLATEQQRTKTGSVSSATPNANRTGAVKDAGGSTGGTKHRYTAKDFTNAVCVKKDDAQVSEIITSGFDIETRFREFHHGTCLHVVCSHGTPAMAYLIMCRARSVDYLNIPDRELHTAVMRAVVGTKCDIVKLLLDSGADATFKGPYGMTVLHLAAKQGEHAMVRTILECARQRLTARALMAFVNAIDNGHWTALAWAAENRHKHTVEELVSIGADVNVRDQLNNTALHWASLSGCSDTLYRLMTKDCNPNMQNSNGETPLHIACREGHAEICVVLLAMEASLNVRNTSNQLPQDIISDPNSECANIIAANVKMRNLSNNLKETHIICSDISNGRERHPIQVVYYTNGANERQLAVPKFKYIQSNVEIEGRIAIDSDARNMHVCSCVDSTCTSTDSECLCSERTWYTNDGRLVNDFNYTDPPTIVECGDLCDCNLRSCRNRVVQHGLDIPLQLCYIPGKGWGVRTLVPIEKGSFLVEYVGEVLPDEAIYHRPDDSYLFDLGNGYCIDASAYGNVSRFFNHSCLPNVSPVSVYYDHKDQRYARVALFACRNIAVQEEICFDYGEKFWVVKKDSMVCRCNTDQCRYRQVG